MKAWEVAVTQLRGSLPTERTSQLAPTSTGSRRLGCFEALQLEGYFSPENQGGDLKGKPNLKDLTIFLGRGKGRFHTHLEKVVGVGTPLLDCFLATFLLPGDDQAKDKGHAVSLDCTE